MVVGVTYGMHCRGLKMGSWRFVASLFVCFAFVLLQIVWGECTTESHSLKACAMDSVGGTAKPFFYGCAVQIELLEGTRSPSGAIDMSTADPDYKQLVMDQCGCITPENSWKMNAMYEPGNTPGTGTFTLENAKRYIDFACDSGIRCLSGHVLGWHHAIDNYDETETLQQWDMSQAEWRDWLRTYVSTVITEMYKYSMEKCGENVIVRWDVASEALVTSTIDGVSGKTSPTDSTKGWRDTHWFRVIGSDYLELLFEWSKAAMVSSSISLGGTPSRLHYTDYSIETFNSKSTLVLNRLTSLQAKGVPIDGVALQSHIGGPLKYGSMRRNLNRFSKRMEVLFSEVDVFHETCSASNFDNEQANIYGQLVQLAREYGLTSFTTWGITDRYSWIPHFFPDRCEALPFSDALGRKKVYCAMIKEFAKVHGVDTNALEFGQACVGTERAEGEVDNGYCGDSICSSSERCNRQPSGLVSLNPQGCGDCAFNTDSDAGPKYCCTGNGCLFKSSWSNFCPSNMPNACPN